jgi:glutamate-1-semialdehyde 2,1-aminomutase
VVQLGARLEVRFTAPPPRTGTASRAAADPDLDDFLHVYAANRGVLLTPFHNMALTCPATTESDVEAYAAVFDDAVAALVG